MHLHPRPHPPKRKDDFVRRDTKPTTENEKEKELPEVVEK